MEPTRGEDYSSSLLLRCELQLTPTRSGKSHEHLDYRESLFSPVTAMSLRSMRPPGILKSKTVCDCLGLTQILATLI